MTAPTTPPHRRIRIKICGLTTEHAIQAAIQAGADYLGFVLAPSKRQLTIARAKQLLADIPPHIQTVAVYRHPETDLVHAALDHLSLHYHQSDHTDFTTTMQRVPNHQRLPVVRMDNAFPQTLHAVAQGSATNNTPPNLILVEGEHSGTGTTIDWSRLTPPHPANIMLAGGLNPTNVASAIRIAQPHAVDVSSGVESQPAMKDPRLIRAFIHAARNAQLNIEHTNPTKASP